MQQMGRKLSDPFSQIWQNGGSGRNLYRCEDMHFQRGFVYMCEVVYNSIRDVRSVYIQEYLKFKPTWDQFASNPSVKSAILTSIHFKLWYYYKFFNLSKCMFFLQL